MMADPAGIVVSLMSFMIKGDKAHSGFFAAIQILYTSFNHHHVGLVSFQPWDGIKFLDCCLVRCVMALKTLYGKVKRIFLLISDMTVYTGDVGAYAHG